MKKILTKQQIHDLRARYKDDHVIYTALRMAEERRRAYHKGRRGRKRKVKTHLRPTDYLSIEQVGRILSYVGSQAEKAKSKTAKRAVVNEMIVVMLLESGLRASEICGLQLRDLPSYHGKSEIEVRDSKFTKDRTVKISEFLKKRIENYVTKYHRGHGLKSWLFRNEQGRQMSRYSVCSRIKVIGVKTGTWLYHKNGKTHTRLSTHKFRHTFGTYLLDVTGNEFLVQDQLGHEKTDTTRIYARTLNAKITRAMNDLHNRVWASVKAENQPNL